MGYYDIRITGKDVKRFIHNLHKKNIEFLNIEFSDHSVIIKVTSSDYKKIKNIKTIYKVEIVKAYGVSYLKSFLKKYSIFLSVLTLGSLFFLLLTNIIFDVEVVHNNSKLRELIINELESEGIKKYNFVVSYDKKEKIKENILKKHKDSIDWIEIERYGTKYIVKVEERKKQDNSEDDKPRSIVAKKNGIIKKIVSSSGEILVKKDMYVRQGDTLISGIIHNKEEEVARVKAIGDVYAETWYNVTVELPYHYHEEIKSGNKQKILRVKWFNNIIDVFDFKNFKNSLDYDTFKLKNNILPISISVTEKEEIEIVDKIYTKDNATVEATNIARNHLKSKLGENIEILYEKSLKITEEDSKIVVVMFYKVFENITDYQYLLENLEEEQSS